jgi:outer membrane protein TolC
MVYSAKNIYRRKLAENLFRSGSGSGRSQKSDTVKNKKNRQDPQHSLPVFDAGTRSAGVVSSMAKIGQSEADLKLHLSHNY